MERPVRDGGHEGFVSNVVLACKFPELSNVSPCKTSCLAGSADTLCFISTIKCPKRTTYALENTLGCLGVQMWWAHQPPHLGVI